MSPPSRIRFVGPFFLSSAAKLPTARHLVGGQAVELPGLLPDLTQILLSPYLGAEQARQLAV